MAGTGPGRDGQGGYLDVLGRPDFRRLWVGATVSAIGDGMTFVALAWLVLEQSGNAARLGLLGICYTGPVLVGGLAVGMLLDRFDKRAVLGADCVLRAAAVASIPLVAAVGQLPGWLPFAVAASYGVLKMVPLAGVPAAIPQLVDEADLDPANALESLSFSVAGVVGPATAGVLVATIGAANVLLIDSVSFLVFAIAVARVRTPLRPEPPGPGRAGDAPALAGLGRDRAIVATTVAFMAFNVAEGMLLVTAPWLARTQLSGGATALGGLLAALAAGEILGATIAGRRRPRRSRVRAIGIVQLAASVTFLAVLAAPRQVPVGIGFFALGLLSAPMTVWAQSWRMRRIPPELHGRAFAMLRTLMQATPPLGSALVTPLLVHGRLAGAAVAMTTVAALPALWLLAGRSDQRGQAS